MKKGLSIIEVMFALTLVAVLMAATSPVLLTSMRSNSDSRVREQAIAAAEGWLDRFRAKTLDFEFFQDGVTYDYGYDYASDEEFVAAGDPSPQALNDEWQPYSFVITTTQFSASPLMYEVKIVTKYRTKIDGEGESNADFELATIISS